MALPVAIGGSDEALSFISTMLRTKGGPYLIGGNVYFVAPFDFASGTVNGAKVYKATDPTSSFSEQDGTNRPSVATSDYWSISTAVSGTIIHIVFTVNTNRDLYYARFDTSTDTWVDASNFGGSSGATEYNVYNPADDVGGEVDIAVRSDSDVIISHTYADTTDMGQDVEGISYHRLEGTTWTTNVDVAQTDTKDQRHNSGAVVMGSSDQCHFGYNTEVTTKFNIRALSSANTLRTERTASVDGTFAQGENHINQGIVYDRSGTETIAFFNATATGALGRHSYPHFTDDSSPTFTYTTAIGVVIEVADPQDHGMTSIGVADTDTAGTNYALYVDATDEDIYARTDSGGTTWSDENSGSRISTNTVTEGRGISANIYTRGGNVVIGFVYDDNDQNYYDEYVLRSSGPSGTGAQTLETFTQTASGAQEFIGSAAQTLSLFVQLGSGTHLENATATGQQTLAALSQSASAAEEFTATAAQVLEVLAQAGAGVHAFEGSGAQTLQALSQDATAVMQPSGTGAQTLETLTQTAQAAQTIAGSGAQALEVITQIANGLMQPSGTGAQTLPALAQSAAALQSMAGSGAQTLEALAQVAAATHAEAGSTGTGAQSLTPLTQAASAAEVLTGSGAQALALIVQSASGVMQPSGAGAQTLEAISQLASGTHSTTTTGTATQALQLLAQVASGVETIPATAAQTLEILAQSANGGQAFTGAAAQTLALLTQAASGTEEFTATAAQTLVALSQAGAGVQTLAGSAVMVVPGLTQSGVSVLAPVSTAAQALEAFTQRGVAIWRIPYAALEDKLNEAFVVLTGNSVSIFASENEAVLSVMKNLISPDASPNSVSLVPPEGNSA